MNDVPIPDYVDSMPQILFWEADEIAPALVLVAVGIVTNTLTYMLIPIWLMTKYFVRFKARYMEGYFHHLVYAWGLGSLNRRFKNALINEWHS